MMQHLAGPGDEQCRHTEETARFIWRCQLTVHDKGHVYQDNARRAQGKVVAADKHFMVAVERKPE